MIVRYMKALFPDCSEYYEVSSLTVLEKNGNCILPNVTFSHAPSAGAAVSDLPKE